MVSEAGRGPVRKYPRMNVEYTVAYRPTGAAEDPNPPLLSKTRSVGLGGMMFESESPLEKGAMLSFDLITGERTVKAEGRVVYVGSAPGGRFENGVEFTSISDDDRDFLLGCYLQLEYRIPPE